MAVWDFLSGALPVFVLLFTTSDGQYFRDGDVRLVGGSYQWEGRVEVFMSGVWGTITDSDWTDEDATAVCRKLGHFRAGATAHSGAYFGEGKGAVNLDSVECTGSEYILTDCQIDNSGMRTSHSLDVGVKCQPAEGSYREGDIRLVGGPTNWEGRVEIFLNGGWGTIRDSEWTVSDARVICRQLQHAAGSGEEVPCCSLYGRGTDVVHMQDVGCSGTEVNITSCRNDSVSVLQSHDYDVGVQCQQGNEVREGEILLNRSSSSNLWVGRVEIFLSGEWGTVCDNGVHNNGARVVCRQLGYNVYGSYRGYYGQGTGPIHFSSPSCNGSEHRLNDCVNQTASCGHYEYWGVYCRIDGPKPLEVQLSYTRYGYVQVFYSGAWVHVADTWGTWGVANSKVVCRQLGYNGTVATSSDSYSFSVTEATIGNVQCSGSEPQLEDCQYNVGVFNIGSVSRVECQYYSCSSTGEIRLVGGDSEREGRVEMCSSGRWGTVCGTHWTYKHTAVVCRYLGYSDLPTDLTYYTSEKYGRGTGPVLMDFINCTGTERRLGYCTYWTHYYGCSHDGDVGVVGVQCKPARCSDGQLRLADGSETSGRVEICSDQRWNTFSRSQWDFYDNSRVACIELGFSSASSYRYYSYGVTGAPRHSKYFRCHGSEPRLHQCTSDNNTYSRSYSSDVGVRCYVDSCVDGQIRLMEGDNQLEGRLEVCYSGRWGTVGADEWTETNSRVVCNSLGYNYSAENSTGLSIPMAPSKPLYYHRVQCSSQHLSLVECGFMRYTDLTETYPNAVIKCQEPMCEDGDLRLVGEATESEGRLEVCFGKRWGTIDGHGWTHTDTQVACRQLGHPTEDVSYTKHVRNRATSTNFLPTFMTLVGCYGTEDKLADCSYHEFESPTSGSMDVSISCNRKDVTERPIDNSESNQSTTERPIESSQGAGGMVYASLSVSVILAVVVIALVAVLIALFVFWQRKRRTAGSSSGITFSSKNETVSLDKNKVSKGENPPPVEGYEKMEALNPLPLPPKSPSKKPLNKSSTAPQNADSTRYSKHHAGAKPQPHVVPKWGQKQQQLQRPLSEEGIYECPD